MFRQKKIIPWILITALLCSFFIHSTAFASAALVIPARQKSVSAQAYFGDNTLQAVVLQEGITSIGPQAFANSSLTDITLPSTLVSIADDAFDGAPLTTVHAEKGSYAYQWMRERGLIAEYRALLIGQQCFLAFADTSDPTAGCGLDNADQRNLGDLLNMTSALGNVIGPRGPYGSGEGAFQVTRKKNLDYSGIRSAIQSTFADTTDQDISIFFIATHGDEKGDGDLRTAFTGDIMNQADVNTYWAERNLSFDTLASWLTTYVKGRVFVILESCGSGSAIYAEGIDENRATISVIKTKKTEDAREAEQADRFAERAVEAFAAADPGVSVPSGPSARKSTGDLRLPKFYVLTASAHQEKSYGWESDDGKAENSYNYFTKWLTKGIGSQGNSPADTNKNDYLTLHEMFDYVKQYDHITYQGKTYEQHVQRYPADSDDSLLKLREQFAYRIAATRGNPHILRSGKDTEYTVSRSARDSETFSRFESVFVDKLALEPHCYEIRPGSLVLTLKSAYLDTLPEGTYKVLIRFSDGETETSLTISPKTKPVPNTGDSSRPLLWLGMLILGLAGLLLTARRPGKQHKTQPSP